VSDRRRSVNLEGSILEENQTLGGYSGQPSEKLGSLMTGMGAPSNYNEMFGGTWDCCPTNAGIPNKRCEMQGSYGYSFERLQALSGILWMYMSNKNTLDV